MIQSLSLDFTWFDKRPEMNVFMCFLGERLMRKVEFMLRLIPTEPNITALILVHWERLTIQKLSCVSTGSSTDPIDSFMVSFERWAQQCRGIAQCIAAFDVAAEPRLRCWWGPLGKDLWHKIWVFCFDSPTPCRNWWTQSGLWERLMSQKSEFMLRFDSPTRCKNWCTQFVFGSDLWFKPLV